MLKGGTWHVEGQLVSVTFINTMEISLIVLQNEHICASAIFYYDEDNISENTLSFR